MLRKIVESDLEKYQYWNLPIHKYHEFNGPYFKKKTEEEVKYEIDLIRAAFQKGIPNPLDKKRIISNDENEIIGEVSWYWKSEETNWMEIGIVIFDPNHWGKGIGYIALELWVEELFKAKKQIVRLGLSTWSGNKGMMKLAEKLGMRKEAEYRRARIVEGVYYDSVSYGFLREEWEDIPRS